MEAVNSISDSREGSVLTSKSMLCRACPNIRSIIWPINVGFGATADSRYASFPAFSRSTITSGSVTVVQRPSSSRATMCVTPCAAASCACTSGSNCRLTSARQRLKSSSRSAVRR